MSSKLRLHWLAACFAVLLGIMTGLPQVIAIARLGGGFHGIYPTNNDDELYYLARGQDVIDGHDTVAQPYLFEGKDRLPLQFWVPDYVIARTSLFLNIPLHHMFTAMDFLLPPVVFLLTYAIGFALSNNRTLSLGSASILHFAIYFTLFNRPISPQLNFIFFLAFLLAILAWERSSTIRRTIIGGVLFGTLFHIYTYYWTYVTVFIALCSSMLIVRQEWNRMKRMMGIILICAVVSIPYFVQLYLSFGYEFYGETVRRVGMIWTHTPSGIYIITLAVSFLLFLALLLCKGRVSLGMRTWFIVLMVIAAPIVANQHVITGQNLEFSSHYSVVATFVFAFGLLYLLPPMFERISPSRRATMLAIGSGVLIGWSLVFAGSVAYAQSFMRADEVAEQRYGETLSWLREHTITDEVVFANAQLSELIPVYTQDNVFFAREANLHYMSDNEVQQRVLISDYFSPTITQKSLIDEERSIWGTYYIDQYAHELQMNKLRHLLGIKEKVVKRYPENEIKSLVDEGNRIKSVEFRDVLSPYRVDYVVWDTASDPEWDVPHKVPGLIVVHKDLEHGILIYKYP